MSQNINLLSPELRPQRTDFSARMMLQAAVVLVVGVLLFYGYAHFQVQTLTRQAAEMNTRYVSEQARLQTFLQEYSPQRAEALLNQEVSRLEAKLAAQDVLLTLLKGGAIGNTNGFSEYMRGFSRQAVNGLWLTGFEIVGDGVQISLSGAATNPQLVPAYLRHLGRERAMRGKLFDALQIRQPKNAEGKPLTTYVEFSLRSLPSAGEGRK